jgi:hypothetical protein
MKYLFLLALLLFAFLVTAVSARADSSERPFGRESLEDARELCRSFTQTAVRQGVRTLVIGFEGLASFDGKGTQQAYSFLKGGERPRRGLSGFLLHGLLVPLMDRLRGHVEFLVFPETSVMSTADSVPSECARAWMERPGNRLVLVGHSYGGHAVNLLAENLEQRRVSIARVVTVDARTRLYLGRLHKTTNVALWENYYQRNTPFLFGSRVEEADLNVDLSRSGVFHGNIPAAPAIRASLMSFLSIK